MKAFYFIYCLPLACLLAGCSGNPDISTTVVKGQITVADSLDPSKNYAGIGITIIQRDSAGAEADTVFYAVTDKKGIFSGLAEFSERRRYPAIISRHGQNITRIGIILAATDTVTITGELPGLEKSLTIRSREHEALETYRRVNRSYQRVAAYVRTGKLRTDSLGVILSKWSNLFWEVYEKNEGTLASELAAGESIRLLRGWNNKGMMDKIRQVQDKDELVNLAATYGKDYLAQSRGLAYTLKYLDSLQIMTEEKQADMRISMERIKLLYDSAQVEQAKAELSSFQKNYREFQAREWADVICYDLNYLSPGDSIPSFSFSDNGQLISRDSLLGTPYILEISSLANALYQEQFGRTVVIHSIYKTYGLQVITIPLDNSQITIDAFFEERVQPWPVAPAGAFDRSRLLERFNIQVVPIRFLVNRNGKIVRKYVRREYKDIIRGIQTLTTKEKPTS